MRAWTWWLLLFSCTLSPSPFPGDTLRLFSSQEVPLGASFYPMCCTFSPNGSGWLSHVSEGVLRHTLDCRKLGNVGLDPLCSLLPLSSPQVGFLRFLFLVSTFDWKNNPLIVNLNSELTGKW